MFSLQPTPPLTDAERDWIQAESKAIASGSAADRRLADTLGAAIDAACTESVDRLAAPDALVGAALWYAGQGVPVFPCRPGGKTPLTKHGFKDASCDPDQIRAWWRRSPNANIGAPTGIRFDVIDIDGTEGLSTWAHQQLQVGTIGHVSTPRPGGHHLYVPTQGVGNRSKSWGALVMAGLDYRGRGGYVVLPPSLSGEHGRRYRWLLPLNLTPALENTDA